MTSIAILGTGHMGTPIARRLLAAGHDVTVWNRTPARAAPLAVLGAWIAATPAEAADGAEVVIVMVTDGPAVHSVLFGERGAAEALKPGTCVVQMSTIGPDEVRALADRLPSAVHVVDAPVAGSVGAVEAGTLTIFAGADDAALAAAEPVLSVLGAVRRCGAIGAGAAVKLVANIGMVSALVALRDALTVATAVGVERKVALDVLSGGPLAIAVQRIGGTGSAFAISLAAKDARLALRGVDGAEVAYAAAQVLQAAAHQEADVASLITKEF
jgi:3-hydroxyisobutyrate dehydrogenase